MRRDELEQILNLQQVSRIRICISWYKVRSTWCYKCFEAFD